ncbi:MAG: tRNA lysidine(34) synthetase TilS [Neisseriaceae bacterium]|nr:tRNA lysidine(34) synthetase TilS [Neisseriaceae bacterium]
MDNLANKLLDIVENAWSALGADRFSCEVALSGGVDSVVLLHLLCRLKEKNSALDLSALHIHHGLQQVADEWVVFCENLCRKWQIPLIIQKVTVNKESGLGVEAAARAARYNAFSGSLKKVVALAHHQNDQVETFMLSVLRGGGVRGMASMPVVRCWQNKILWRPLLGVSRSEIEEYAKIHQLPFIEDPTNTDTAYTRNYLRHVWLPEIEEKIPNFAKQIESNIKQLQNALAILDEVAKNDLAETSPQNGVIDLDKLSKLSAPRRLEVLYLFIKNNQLGNVERNCLDAFEKQLYSHSEKYIELQTPQGFLYAQYGFLWAFVANEFSGSLSCEWQSVKQGLPDEIIGSLMCRQATKHDTIRTKIGHKSVWKLLQEKKIPKFIRPKWCVWVDSTNQCVAVANLRCDETLSVKNGKMPVINALQAFISGSLK